MATWVLERQGLCCLAEKNTRGGNRGQVIGVLAIRADKEEELLVVLVSSKQGVGKNLHRWASTRSKSDEEKLS